MSPPLMFAQYETCAGTLFYQNRFFAICYSLKGTNFNFFQKLYGENSLTSSVASPLLEQSSPEETARARPMIEAAGFDQNIVKVFYFQNPENPSLRNKFSFLYDGFMYVFEVPYPNFSMERLRIQSFQPQLKRVIVLFSGSTDGGKTRNLYSWELNDFQTSLTGLKVVQVGVESFDFQNSNLIFTVLDRQKRKLTVNIHHHMWYQDTV